jgi:hypothetical protein
MKFSRKDAKDAKFKTKVLLCGLGALGRERLFSENDAALHTRKLLRFYKQ